MKIQRLLLTSVLAATLLATAAPLGASTLVEANPKVVVRQGEAFSGEANGIIIVNGRPAGAITFTTPKVTPAKR